MEKSVLEPNPKRFFKNVLLCENLVKFIYEPAAGVNPATSMSFQ
jgi:hypothetical protein